MAGGRGALGLPLTEVLTVRGSAERTGEVLAKGT